MLRIILALTLLPLVGCGVLSAPEPVLRDGTINRCVSLSQNRYRPWEVQATFDVLLDARRLGLSRDEISGAVGLTCLAESRRGIFADLNECMACFLPMLDDLYR
jgi:hypothetical protein